MRRNSTCRHGRGSTGNRDGEDYKDCKDSRVGRDSGNNKDSTCSRN